jgi:hypothetical protein
MKKTFLLCLILTAAATAFSQGSNSPRAGAPVDVQLDADEELIFFPGYTFRDPISGSRKVRLHAWVFEPEEGSTRRKLLLKFLGSQLGDELTGNEKALLFARGAHLMADQESGRDVAVSIACAGVAMGSTDAGGHAVKDAELPAGAAAKLSGAARGKAFWLEYRSRSKDRTFRGKALVIPDEGVSVVSDIDDTIKISEVLDRRALLRNTFLLPFRAVPGMASLYASWLARGAVFHYVTGSPWQLYRPLDEFITTAGFPAGMFHMKKFGLRSNLTSLFDPADAVKIPAITELLERFPRRRFVLVGDSGERDPEIYGEIARRFPGRIIAIFIRNAGNDRAGSPRLAAAFRDLGALPCVLFGQPSEIRGVRTW